MRAKEILIFVSAVTLLSACGGKKSSQPNIVGANNGAKTVEGSLEGSGQCQSIETDNKKELCETLREKIIANDPCKKPFGFVFIAETCENEVGRSTPEFSSYIAGLSTQNAEVTLAEAEQGVTQAQIGTQKETKEVVLNPEVAPQAPVVAQRPAPVEQVSTSTPRKNDGVEFVVVSSPAPVSTQDSVTRPTNTPDPRLAHSGDEDILREALDVLEQADVQAVDDRVYPDDIDVVHVVHLPDYSDKLDQVELVSEPEVRITKTDLETRVEEVFSTRLRVIGTRDYSLSVEEQATAQCLELYQDTCDGQKFRRAGFKTRYRCKRTMKKNLKMCEQSATVRTVTVN